MSRVLLVDDEASFTDALSYLLIREGFEVEVVGSGAEALTCFERDGADVVLLDVMLPGMSGIEVCQAIRRRSDVPIIMLSARDQEADKVVGLESGADDYVSKPFSARELVSRLRAAPRRRQRLPDESPSVLDVGPVRMDLDRHSVTVRGEPTHLPLKEFQLLELLLRHAGRVVTRRILVDRVWGGAYQGDERTVDVHVKRLRDKIEQRPHQPQHLVTVRGLGYRFQAG